MRGLFVLLFALLAGPALAQVTPGTSPLSGSKGGTNNSFMQFSGPASSLKTYTLPNASGTLAMLSQIQTWTAAQTFAAITATTYNGGALSGTFSGTPTFSGTNFITNANLAQMPANTVKCNPTGSPANAQDCAAGTGVLSALGNSLNASGGLVGFGGALGTPSSGTLTNATGLPISTGVSGLGTGIATALGNPINASGGLVGFGGSIGTATASSLTSSGTIIGNASGGGPVAAFLASAAVPAYGWQATGQAADQKLWDAVAVGTQLQFRALNDALTVANPWMTVTRGAGASIASVSIPNTVTINPPAATTNQGFNVTQSGPNTGTNVGAFVNFNNINISSDATNTGGGANTVNGLNVILNSGGANAQGARQAGFFQNVLTAPTSASNNNRNYVGLVGVGTCSTGDGGTGVTLATAKGGCFGGNFVAQTGGTNWLDVTGQENDIQIVTGGSSVGRSGISLVSGGNVQASVADSAIRVSQGGGTIGWQTALLLSDLNSGVTPLSANGCIICTNFRGGPYTITTGIDLTGLTVAGNIFNSSSFRVSGSGVFSRYTAVSGTPSLSGCTGLGTGSCLFFAGAQDNAGHIQLQPTGTPAGTGAVTLNFSGALGTNGASCTFTTANSSAGWSAITSITILSASSTSVTFQWANNGGSTALVAGSTYGIFYICMGF